MSTRTRESATHYLPTFLGIGSMRGGSTWLYEVLKEHPDIRLAKNRKEMDFFFMKRMLEQSLEWYTKHFEPDGPDDTRPIRGEISPRYAWLKEWQVRRIAEMIPHLRVILTLRHPVERLWSQVQYQFGHWKKRDIPTIPPIDFMREIERSRSQLASDYCRTIRNWSNAFGPEALHIDLFERIRKDPEGYAKDILRHLGADTNWTFPEKLKGKKVWATNSLVKKDCEMPEIIRWYMSYRLLEPTKRLNDMLGGRVTHWVDEMQAITSNCRASWRIMGEINRWLLSPHERIAYQGYHAMLDVRLWFRWKELKRSLSA